MCFRNACIGVLFVGSWHEDTAVAGPHHPRLPLFFKYELHNYKQASENICGSYSFTQTFEHTCLYKQFLVQRKDPLFPPTKAKMIDAADGHYNRADIRDKFSQIREGLRNRHTVR